MFVPSSPLRNPSALLARLDAATLSALARGVPLPASPTPSPSPAPTPQSLAPLAARAFVNTLFPHPPSPPKYTDFALLRARHYLHALLALVLQSAHPRPLSFHLHLHPTSTVLPPPLLAHALTQAELPWPAARALIAEALRTTGLVSFHLRAECVSMRVLGEQEQLVFVAGAGCAGMGGADEWEQVERCVALAAGGAGDAVPNKVALAMGPWLATTHEHARGRAYSSDGDGDCDASWPSATPSPAPASSRSSPKAKAKQHLAVPPPPAMHSREASTDTLNPPPLTRLHTATDTALSSPAGSPAADFTFACPLPAAREKQQYPRLVDPYTGEPIWTPRALEAWEETVYDPYGHVPPHPPQEHPIPWVPRPAYVSQVLLEPKPKAAAAASPSAKRSPSPKAKPSGSRPWSPSAAKRVPAPPASASRPSSPSAKRTPTPVPRPVSAADTERIPTPPPGPTQTLCLATATERVLYECGNVTVLTGGVYCGVPKDKKAYMRRTFAVEREIGEGEANELPEAESVPALKEKKEIKSPRPRRC